MEPVSPKLGHPHHRGQDRHAAVGDAGPLRHGCKPVLDVLDRNLVHRHMPEGGQDAFVDNAPVGLQRVLLPVAGVTLNELCGELGHRAARCSRSVGLRGRIEKPGDDLPGLSSRLGHRDRVGGADGCVAPAAAHAPLDDEGAFPARMNAEHEAGEHVVADGVSLVTWFGGANALGEGGRPGIVGHGRRLPVRAAATGPSNRKRARRRFSKGAAQQDGMGNVVRL